MKKAWTVLSILLLSTAFAACSKKGSNNSTAGQGVCYDGAYGCTPGDGGVGGGVAGGYGYVGGGKWRGSIIVTNPVGFQKLMQMIQPIQCFAAGCVISADYAKVQIKLRDMELPQETTTGMLTFSGGYSGQVIWTRGTAFALAGGTGFVITSKFMFGGPQPQPYGVYPGYPVANTNPTTHVAAKLQKVQIMARFIDPAHRLIQARYLLNGQVVAEGQLRAVGRVTYDYAEEYMTSSKATRPVQRVQPAQEDEDPISVK